MGLGQAGAGAGHARFSFHHLLGRVFARCWVEVLAGDSGTRCWEDMAGGDAWTPTSPSAWLHPAHFLRTITRGCARETGPGAAAARQSPPAPSSQLPHPPQPPTLPPPALLWSTRPAVPCCALRRPSGGHLAHPESGPANPGHSSGTLPLGRPPLCRLVSSLQSGHPPQFPGVLLPDQISTSLQSFHHRWKSALLAPRTFKFCNAMKCNSAAVTRPHAC